MITIDGHTFDEERLGYGWLIDAGCRGFELAKHWRFNRDKVLCLDIEHFEKPKEVTIFKHAALSATPGQTEAYYFGDGTGNFLKGINETPGNEPDRPCETKSVERITLKEIYREIGNDIDLLKLDIEGSEYEILADLDPIPRQITVEFHEHCHPKLHNKYIDKIMNHLCEYYACVLHITEPRYKYMDCLFIRKDLI